MDKKKKIVLTISIISLIIIIAGGTTAFFGWRAEKQAIVDVTIASGEGKCLLKRDNAKFIEPSINRNGGRIIKLTAIQNMEPKASIAWNLNIKSIDGLQNETFKYEMINTSTGASYGSGTFENIVAGNTITFSNTEEVLGFGLEYEFTLYLWIDGTLTNNQLPMAGKTLDFDINCDMVTVTEGEISYPTITPENTAAEYIKTLYYESDLELITQSSSGDQYYYSPSEQLMNDGLGEEGNVRYYGADPNNYIYFNCSDYNNPTSNSCELWRIIGVFDNKLKIVRADSLITTKWDEENADWNYSSLNSNLNNLYYNNNSTTNFNISGKGIKENTKNLIADNTWYLGAWDKSDIYPKDAYYYERGFERCTTCGPELIWTGKIGLPYASDYGFSADLSICDKDMYNYNDQSCIKNNWLYNEKNTKNYIWLLTTHHEHPNYAWSIYPNGYVRTGGKVTESRGVLPTLYLNSNVEFQGVGDGSSSNPYRIVSKKQTLIQHITNLYENTSKNEVTNNGIKYNYAKDVSLMNDRLGSSSVGANSGNIRYYGANPNNYVDLGDVYTTNKVDNFVKYQSVLSSIGINDRTTCNLLANCDNILTQLYFDGKAECENYLYKNLGTTDTNEICGETPVTPGTTKALYRIVGVFQDIELADGTKKDLIKVVKDTPVVNATWDIDESTINDGNGINEWSLADLQKLLNPGYENEDIGGSLYWNSVDGGKCHSYIFKIGEGDGTFAPLNCNFSVLGLGSEVKNKIVEAKWNTGGWNTPNLYANQIYQYERGTNVVVPGISCSGSYCNDTVIRKTSWLGNVAVPYPSDYGYATDLSDCNYDLNNYDNCATKNWLHQNMTIQSSYEAWLLTPYTNSTTRVYLIGIDGKVHNRSAIYSRSITPAFYIAADLELISGTGSKTDPYKVG